MELTLYGVNYCTSPIGRVAWLDEGYSFKIEDVKETWRSRGRHDPGDGPYRYWGYRKKGEYPKHGDIQLIPYDYFDHRDASESDHYEVIYPNKDGFLEVRHWWWGPFFWGDGWGAEQHVMRGAYRHWAGTSYANKDVYYTYGSHRSLDDPPTDHWYDINWFGRENQAVWEPNGGKLRSNEYWIFSSADPGKGPAMDPAYFDVIDLGYEGSINNALSRVYTAACSSLPRTSMNNIANVLDIVSMLKNFVGGHLDLPRGLRGLTDLVSSGWMGYRYAYGTTKMDIEDGVTLVNRLRDIAKADEVRSNAAESFTYDNTTYTVRCSVTFGSSQLQEVQSFAERWGIALSAYNIWDMIPYSFIVDWFLDIGGLIEYYEGYNYALRLTPVECWFSISKVVKYSDSESETYFYRFPGRPPDVIPVYTSYTPGSATLIRRGLDVIAMLL